MLNACVDNAHTRKKARTVLLKPDTSVNEYLCSEPTTMHNNKKVTFKTDIDKINIYVESLLLLMKIWI